MVLRSRSTLSPATVAALSRYDLSSLSTLLHLAAPCPEWLKRFWIDLIGPGAVWEIYGGAERFGAGFALQSGHAGLLVVVVLSRNRHAMRRGLSAADAMSSLAHDERRHAMHTTIDPSDPLH